MSDHNKDRYIKMRGRKVYEFALKNVPAAIKDCIDLNAKSRHFGNKKNT